ncbi:MAG: mevalonate kinase [Candidatus Bathyarchaeia archaeon]
MSEVVVTSSPGKVILFGEHGVNRNQPAIATAVNIRTYCRVSKRNDDLFSLNTKGFHEVLEKKQLLAFKRKVNALRKINAFDEIKILADNFLSTPCYVLAHLIEGVDCSGLDVAWKSSLPIRSGLGSGAAASTSMALAILKLIGDNPKPDKLAYLAWQGDYIAHGGIASSLDSSTCAYGGLIKYSASGGVEPLPLEIKLPLVVGDTKIRTDTATVNTHVRKWLDDHPMRMHLFREMGYLVEQAIDALENRNFTILGKLMNLHQLIQEKIGTSCPENEKLIEASLSAGALGAKISGSGEGGIIIALVEPDRLSEVADAIERAGGRSIIVDACVEGTRIEPGDVWRSLKPIYD